MSVSGRNQAIVDFEGKRVLDDSWVRIQKKTFTKWLNTHLKTRGLSISELETAFENGIVLIALCEILSNTSLGRYDKNPSIRIKKIQNVQTALKFIVNSGFRLENLSAEDIVDKNLKLILGLVWTIIQKFVIAGISLEELTAKEALLLWCKRKT
jgi:hypothetical protein